MNTQTIAMVARRERERSRQSGESFAEFQTGFPTRFAHALRFAAAAEHMPAWIRDVPILVAELGARHGQYDDAADVVTINRRLFDEYGTMVSGVDQLTFVVCHELGHAMMHRLGLRNDPAWLGISGWEKTVDDAEFHARYVETRLGWPAGPSEWRYQELAWFTRPYASKSPDEDFADCAAYVGLGLRAAFVDGGAAKRAYMDHVFRRQPSAV